MKVIILWGKGLRMYELTEDMPKPMALVCGKPMLWHIMKNYKHFGFNDFILLLGYKGEKIKSYFVDYAWKYHNFRLDSKNGSIELLENQEDWKITFLDTGLDTMTGSRIKEQKIILAMKPLWLHTGMDFLTWMQMNCLHITKNGEIATVTGKERKHSTDFNC